MDTCIYDTCTSVALLGLPLNVILYSRTRLHIVTLHLFSVYFMGVSAYCAIICEVYPVQNDIFG